MRGTAVGFWCGVHATWLPPCQLCPNKLRLLSSQSADCSVCSASCGNVYWYSAALRAGWATPGPSWRHTQPQWTWPQQKITSTATCPMVGGRVGGWGGWVPVGWVPVGWVPVGWPWRVLVCMHACHRVQLQRRITPTVKTMAVGVTLV
jgi:hypothetical protein